MVGGGGGAGVVERFLSGRGDGLLDGLVLERGSVSDYAALGDHHYLGGPPGSCARVWVLRCRGDSVVGRFVGVRGGGEVVGVLVESNPRLGCRMRDVALGGRYSGLGMGQRGLALYEELRCISRVVVDPRWRGLGLAVRLVRHSLAHGVTRFTEAVAAMGRVHPFFSRAGMLAYEPVERRCDARLRAVLGRVGVGELELADVARAEGVIGGLGEAERCWLGMELGRWCRERRLDGVGLRGRLVAARRRLGFEPVYYLWDREWGGVGEGSVS